MSHTNSTPNYNLPQFVGTDKPTWLNDVNGAMSAIDTQMKANADSATQANTNATTANTNIGTLANLNTTDKTSLVNAINETNTKVGTATNTANSAVATAEQAQTDANSANNAIQALADYINLNTFNNYNQTSQFTRISGTGNVAIANLYVARNSAGTLAKIYGAVAISSTTAGTTPRVKLTQDTGLRPESAITITGVGVTSSSGNIANLNILINPDGTLELWGYANSTNADFRPFGCLLFLKDFGDAPSNS
jgi:hypothetical protein